MAAAAALIPVAGAAAGEGIETAEKGAHAGLRVSREAIMLSEEVINDFRAEAQKVLSRHTSHYDYEKVFFNSLYSAALVSLGWFALKMGQGAIALTKALNDFGITGWMVDDEAMRNMEIVGEQLARVDRVVTPLMPVLPVSMIALQSALEYRRVRSSYDKDAQKVADATIGGGALAALYLAWSAYEKTKAVVPPNGNGNGDGEPPIRSYGNKIGQIYDGPKTYILMEWGGFTVWQDTSASVPPSYYWVCARNKDNLIFDVQFSQAGTNALIEYFRGKIAEWNSNGWNPP